MAGTDFEAMSEAGEYVLGTLDTAERIAFEARLARDAALWVEVEAWQRRLAPLDGKKSDTEPPTGIFDRIMARIDTPPLPNVIHLQRRMKAWRNAAAALAAIAATLLIVVLTRPTAPISQKGVYVAVLQGGDKTTGFIAAVDIQNRVIAVRSVTARAPTGRSYELWALGGGRKTPQPVGIIQASTRLSANAVGDKSLADTTFAVSLEPAGGSPTGLPTGPVLFTGKLIATE